ncbi:toll-like receptor 4 [Mercenaria mercenaria]|uniref:toll-like receptor 4 n=1 Tax=Mercenaria mercenaria TaxID=6596 RepID=UPI00234F3BE0|nr:toll-like receptor 4 [Mercenaria mercenaria]
MDIKSYALGLLFISAVFFSGIFISITNASFCEDYEKYSANNNCTCDVHGFKCYSNTLKLVSGDLSFLRHLYGDHDTIENLETAGNEDAFTISSSIFLPFINLKTLRIHNCNIVDIEPGAFRSLHRLEVLEISGNSNLTLDSVTKGLILLNSPNLQMFNISGNHNAENLPGAFIRKPMFERLSNTSLKSLDVSWTRLTTLLAPFDLLPHLETLNISGTLLLGSLSCLSTLASLSNLSYIAIDHWPFFPRGYDSIRLSEEPHGLFKRNSNGICTQRKYLSDRGCLMIGERCRTLQMRFIDLDSFFLDLSKGFCMEKNNMLNHVASNSRISKQLGLILGLDKLKLFDMSNPEVLFRGPLIKPNMFYAMPSLEVLRLAGFHLNRLSNEHIRKLVSRNYNLTELDISYNELTKLPKKMFIENIFLEYLNISWNKLTVFETDLSSCVHLLSVDLQQNLLIVIDVIIVQHFTSLGRNIEINLNGNELECNCNLLTFTKDVNVTITPFRCSYKGESKLITKDVSETFFQNVCDAQEQINSMIILLGATLGVLGTALIIIAAVIIYRRRKSSILRKSVQENMPVVINLTDSNRLEESPSRNPKFVVFLAYCSKDAEFVLKKIYEKLNLKLLQLLKDTAYVNDPDHLIIIYDKHFLAGIDIDEICRVAITESHVTVAVVTDNFLESSWCNLEVKMAISSKVPLLPLFITKCDPKKLTGFLRVVYEEKVRLLWPDTSLLDETLAEAEENKLLDTLCSHIITYVKLHKDMSCKM